RDSWSPSSGDHLSRGERSMIRSALTMTKRTPLASRGMVVAEHPIGAQVGASILARGGNAVDAAVATAFAMPVVEPFMSSIAGGGSFLIHMARRGETVGIDANVEAPAAAHQASFRLGEGAGGELPQPQGRARRDGGQRRQRRGACGGPRDVLRAGRGRGRRSLPVAPR